MPNWCWNCVTFSGEEKNLESLKKLVEKTIEQEEKTGRGQLLFGLEGHIDGYMFSLCMSTEDTIIFDSRWSPIPQDMVRIAQLFNLTFTYEYEESGCCIYGCYTYDSDGYLYDQFLSEADVEECKIPDEDDSDELNSIDYEKLWNMVANAELISIELHSALKQPA
jgi:hypothetical protein